MRVVLLGPPGSGKGTQAKNISSKYGVCHVSTGEIFRENISKNTPLGVEAKKYIDKGLLVPDNLTIQIVENRLAMDDCKSCFVFDGFPRTIAQADSLDEMLEKIDKKLTYVFNISVPEEVIVARITGRRVCTKCGENYHMIYKKPKHVDECDFCKNALIQRQDDNEATIRERYKVYTKLTEPLIEYYNNNGNLVTINGTQEINKVFKDICDVIGSE